MVPQRGGGGRRGPCAPPPLAAVTANHCPEILGHGKQCSHNWLLRLWLYTLEAETAQGSCGGAIALGGVSPALTPFPYLCTDAWTPG